MGPTAISCRETSSPGLPPVLVIAILGPLLAGQPTAAQAETLVGGDILENTTWDPAGSPYHVVDTLVVKDGATLTILPGTEVRLDQTLSIFVDIGSMLDAQGTPDSVIVFTRSSAFGYWGTIGGWTADMIFRNCLIEWGDTGLFNGNFYDGMVGHLDGTTVIEDCTLQRSHYDATEFTAGSVVFRRNLVQDTGRQAFNSWDRCVATIEDNRIERSGDDAFDIDTVREGELIFRNNIAIDVGDDGLDIDDWDLGNVRVGYFEAYGVEDKGVSVSTNTQSLTAENMIMVDCGEAYTVTNHSALSVFNCVAYGCGRGFSAYQKDPPWAGGVIHVASSITWDTVEPVHLDSLSQGLIWHSILDTPTADPCAGLPGCTPGPGNLNVNPNFLGPEQNDFRLRYDSPAIDAGWSDAMPETDIRGNPRVDHPGVPDTGAPPPFTYYDIGAHEFDPTVAAVLPDGRGAPAAGRFGLRASPSPAFGNVTIDFELAKDRDVEIGIYDLAGRLVERLHGGKLAAGRHTVNWQASRGGSGIYFIRLRAGVDEETERLVRLRPGSRP